MICSYIAWRCLYKLGYEYKDWYKDIFIDELEQSDIVENYKIFFKKIEKLKPYIVEFEKNDTIKTKVYLSDCKVSGNH